MGFQSTLPRGERPSQALNTTNNLSISIHAPTRGATERELVATVSVVFQSTLPRGERRCFQCTCKTNSIFQSTLPRGERHCNGYFYSDCTGFQSTLPRGERLSIHRRALPIPNFNPRSHEGSDRDLPVHRRE